MTAPKMMKGINAITTNANFQPETKARARHPTAVIKDEAMVPKRGPVALIKKKNAEKQFGLCYKYKSKGEMSKSFKYLV